jgi:DNA repair protein RadC
MIQTKDVCFVREVTVRYRGRRLAASASIREPLEAVKFAQQIARDDAREHFIAIYLDGRHRPIAHSLVSIGTATASLVHPREVFQPAVLVGAVATLILHNHPSGDPSPSREDWEVAERLVRAGELLGIRLLDSIVWAGEGAFLSMRAERPDLFRA